MTTIDFSGLKVLLIDDNQHFRVLLRTILMSLGVVDIREAQDGGDGLAVLATFPADLVILDWKMVPMDGVTFAHKVRRGGATLNSRVPILMLTAFGSDKVIEEGRAAGVDAFLTKPVSARALITQLIQVLEEPRSWVEQENYVGPERRLPNWQDEALYQGTDRRLPVPLGSVTS